MFNMSCPGGKRMADFHLKQVETAHLKHISLKKLFLREHFVLRFWTKKAQNKYFLFCLKLKIAIFGLFSIMAQFGCLVSDDEPWKTVIFNILGRGGEVDTLIGLSLSH